MYFLIGKKYQKPNARRKLRASRLRLLNEHERLRFSHIRSGRSRGARRSFRNFHSAFFLARLWLLHYKKALAGAFVISGSWSREGSSLALARVRQSAKNRAPQEPAGRSLRRLQHEKTTYPKEDRQPAPVQGFSLALFGGSRLRRAPPQPPKRIFCLFIFCESGSLSRAGRRLPDKIQ